MGGASAQSYSAVSLNVSQVALGSEEADTSAPFSPVTDTSTQSDTEITSQSFERLVTDASAPLFIARSSILNVAEELSEPPSISVEPDMQNPELMSRFEDAFEEDEGGAVAQPTGAALGTSLISEDSSEALSPGSVGFSLLDFIEQAIAQAQASQQEFDETFDGSRQGEFRELLVDTGAAVDSGIREFLQENIAGLGRDLLSSSINAAGVEFLEPIADPLLNIDYYAKSAEVLNGLLDSAAQPIGSIALPRVGPLLADPREELSAYLG